MAVFNTVMNYWPCTVFCSDQVHGGSLVPRPRPAFCVWGEPGNEAAWRESAGVDAISPFIQ